MSSGATTACPPHQLRRMCTGSVPGEGGATDVDSSTTRGGLTAYVLLGPVAEHLPPVLQVVQLPALASTHPEDHSVPTLPRLTDLALVREWVGDGLGEELEAVAVAELVWMR